MLGVFVGSAALIIILSVFNGFENIVLSMYNTFSPELRIEPGEGKTFDPSGSRFINLKNDKRFLNYTEVLEEKALVRYGESQSIALIKGVGEGFMKNRTGLDSVISSGSFSLHHIGRDMAVIGSGLQNSLSVNLNNEFQIQQMNLMLVPYILPEFSRYSRSSIIWSLYRFSLPVLCLMRKN